MNEKSSAPLKATIDTKREKSQVTLDPLTGQKEKRSIQIAQLNKYQIFRVVDNSQLEKRNNAKNFKKNKRYITKVFKIHNISCYFFVHFVSSVICGYSFL